MLHEIKIAVVSALVASSMIDDARAEARHAVPDASAILESIYERIDLIQERTSQFVLARAETEVALKFAAADRLPKHRPLINSFVIAHLEP